MNNIDKPLRRAPDAITNINREITKRIDKCLNNDKK